MATRWCLFNKLFTNVRQYVLLPTLLDPITNVAETSEFVICDKLYGLLPY